MPMLAVLASVLQNLVVSTAQNLVAQQVMEAIDNNMGDDEKKALDTAVNLMTENKATNIQELLAGK
jgi:hypothetical protein|tara:strand:- start:272 stop:469 length:198 start_codon:yes stop_codon:yes gene_type:complete